MGGSPFPAAGGRAGRGGGRAGRTRPPGRGRVGPGAGRGAVAPDLGARGAAGRSGRHERQPVAPHAVDQQAARLVGGPLEEDAADHDVDAAPGEDPQLGAVEEGARIIGCDAERLEHTFDDVAAVLREAGADADVRLKLSPPFRTIGNDRGLDGMLTLGATPLLRAAQAGAAGACAPTNRYSMRSR